MANYIVSYDLNGSKPTHAEMDKHMGEGWLATAPVSLKPSGMWERRKQPLRSSIT